MKRRRERYQKQNSLLSKLTRQLSIHDNRAADASSWSNSSAEGICIKVYFLLICIFIRSVNESCNHFRYEVTFSFMILVPKVMAD